MDEFFNIDLVSDDELLDAVFRRFDHVVIYVKRDEGHYEIDYEEFSDYKGESLICQGMCQDLANTIHEDRAFEFSEQELDDGEED